MTQDDPVVARIRAARRRIVAQCGADPHKIYEWAKQMEARYKDRVVTYERLGQAERKRSSEATYPPSGRSPDCSN